MTPTGNERSVPRSNVVPGGAGTSLDNARIRFSRWGDFGPRVLLIHAIGLDHRSWRSIAPLLQDDFQLVAIDLPGHGESDKPAGADYSLRSMGRRVIGFLDEIGWENCVLLGNSIGGGTALAAALHAPERIRGLALINSVGLRAGLPLVGRLSGLPFVPLLSRFAPALLVRLGLEAVRGRWGSVTPERCDSSCRYFRSAEGRTAFFTALRALYGVDLDAMAPLYATIRCPTILIHGTRDPLIRLTHAEKLAAAIPGAELVPIPACGHFAQEEAPGRVAREFHRFMDRHFGGPAGYNLDL